MANNYNSSKFKKMLKSKGFVTAMCAVLAVVVLVIGYNIRINNATKPVKVPVANKKLTARHLITQEDIDWIEMPQGALRGDYYASDDMIVDQYVNVDTAIPEGSLFYRGAIISESELPDAALVGVKEGETLYYLEVNMLSSYLNSILPNRYIDLYISTKDNQTGKAMVGRLMKNVKILQVKTSDGTNVFEDAENPKSPSVIMFSLPEEQHLLLRKLAAINDYSVTSKDGSFSTIEIIPIPTTNYSSGEGEDLPPEIASDYLQDYILDLAATIPENVSTNDFVPAANDTDE